MIASAVVVACSTPLVKPEAFAADVRARWPLPAAHLVAADHDEVLVEPGLHWMADLDFEAGLNFVGLTDSGRTNFAVVADCNPQQDHLVIVPLRPGETPLDVLRGPRRAEVRGLVNRIRDAKPVADSRVLSLAQVIREHRLTTPIPPAHRVFAVAANFPSHVLHDLGGTDLAGHFDTLRRSRARVFVKYPPTPPPGSDAKPPEGLTGLIGPYDPIEYTKEITVPADGEGKQPGTTATRLDYEVEIAVVISRELRPEDLPQLSDADLMRAVAGYVLMGDTKARNPQVINRLRSAEREATDESRPYESGDEEVDAVIGTWDRITATWWSYAAGWGNYASVGPVFFAPDGHSFEPRAMISARSYAPRDRRGFKIPGARRADTLYLRQCSVTTEGSHTDRLIWGVPSILRSILAPGSVLGDGTDDRPTLHPGDVISLGTPGGAVITSRSPGVIGFLRWLLFWWTPRDFHDAFFGSDVHLYLHDGDQVFYWAEGLGYQHHTVRRLGSQPEKSASHTSFPKTSPARGRLGARILAD